ncbi:MAG: ABC transporter permease [Lachnospiraceae bacterium]|nr:ABC transporter permease [Lachnospiraceae bacterium]
MRKRNGAFSGFGKVFRFTFRHQAEGKGFKFATYVIPFLLMGLVIAILSFMAFDNVKKTKQEPVNIEKLYVIDETDYGMFGSIVGYSITSTDLKDVTYKSVTNTTTDTFLKDNKDSLAEESGWGILSLSKEIKHAEFGEENTEDKEILVVRLTLPSGSEVNYSTREKTLELGSVAAKGVSATASEVTTEQYMILSGSHMSQIIDAGKKEDNLILTMVRYIGPFLFTILMYTMLLLYCMGMGKNLVVEKSSKLMEMLLTSISPVALVAGKVMAIICVALLQFALWIASVVAGFIVGNIVAKMIDPSFVNPINQLIDLLLEYGNVSFTPVQVVLALLALIFGFASFCVLAAVIASTCAKAEEVAQKQGILNLVIIAGYMLAIVAALGEVSGEGENKMMILADMIPFSAAFRLPVDVLLGSVSNGLAALSVSLMVILTIVFSIVAGKVYKAQVFLAGNSIVSNAKRALFGKKKSKE